MYRSYEAFTLKIALDTIIPLENGTYHVSKNDIEKVSLTVTNIFDKQEKIGSFDVHGDIHLNHSHGRGRSKIEITYHCDNALTIEEFAEKKSISSIWHMSATGWDFALNDLNRIIDLYRYFANAYWWHHISIWNVDELIIHGKPATETQLVFISQSTSPKIIKFGGKPLDDIAYNKDSAYLTHLISGNELPLYFLMYLNGRRSFVEHAYKEALIEWANCIEAYGMHLLLGACKLTSISSNEEEKFLEAANEYKKRYSRAYEILSNSGIFPTVTKKRAMHLIDNVMEYRNDVMHGRNPNLSWETVGEKQDAINELLAIATELSI